eukprot:COSAG04_NODE_8180_length_1010_cov_1.666301_1_plen_32_part_10
MCLASDSHAAFMLAIWCSEPVTLPAVSVGIEL